MREIKFRAWEKHAKRMAEVTAFKWQPDHLYHQVYTRAIVNQKMIDEWYAYDFGGDSNGIILMQYTGLKDRNGKEIYEGDIVVAWSAGLRAVGEVKKRIDGLWIMYPAYQEGKFWGLCPNSNGETSVEIISNIHENPELLEVK